MRLSEAQMAAAIHLDGPALCIAGPGSGKTAVIVNRVGNLIRSGVLPEEILVVTFAKAAARNMEKRFFENTGISGVRFSTIHSVCYNVIHNGQDSAVFLIPENIKRNTLLRLSELDSNKHYFAGDRLYHDLTMEISRFKSCLDKEKFDRGNDVEYLKEYETHFVKKELFGKLYPAYSDFLKNNGYYDFDDMTFLAWKKLETMSNADKKRFMHRYLLIDEFQDTSFSQLRFLSSVSESDNVFVVGDDDQSIFSFRGSSPSILKKFCSLYPDTKTYYLEDNYRCNKIITSAANMLIRKNKNRFPKEIRPVGGSVSPFHGVEVREYKTEHDEIKNVADHLKSWDTDCDKSFAILTRTNYEAQLICNMLKRRGIDYISALKDKNPFEHHSTDMILSFISLSAEKHVTLTDLINVFKVLMPEVPVAALSACCKEDCDKTFVMLNDYSEKAGFERQFKEALNRLKLLSEMPPEMQVFFIRNACGLDMYYKLRCMKKGEEYDIYESCADAFAEFSKDFSTSAGLLEYMKRLKDEAACCLPVPEKDKRSNINVMTLHASKGLEFDHVWIINVNQGIIPFRKAVENGMIEEERRLFYVGMTRARDKLFLSWHRSVGNKKSERSVFLKELSSFC